jgi:hypothetical protein
MWEGFNSVHVLETEDFLFVLRGIYHRRHRGALMGLRRRSR